MEELLFGMLLRGNPYVPISLSVDVLKAFDNEVTKL